MYVVSDMSLLSIIIRFFGVLYPLVRACTSCRAEHTESPDHAPRSLVTYNRRSWRCTGVGSQGCAHRRAPDLRSVASTVYGDRYTVYGTAVDERDVTVTVILVLYYVHLNVHRVCIPYPASTLVLSTCSAAVPRPPLIVDCSIRLRRESCCSCRFAS